MRSFLIFMLLVSTNCATAQLRYPVVGTYQKKSAQGMAVWGNNAFLFNDGGHCRVLNLKTGKVEREFGLASSGANTHVNAACFGKEYFEQGDVPLIYISEYKTPSRCFVESVQNSASVLVQTIHLQNKGKPSFVQSWIVDPARQHLYAVSRMAAPKGEKNSKRVKVSKFLLPRISDGAEVILTHDDCLDSFVVEFASGTQGGTVRGKYLYIVSGLQESARGQFNAERAIQVIDLKKKKLVRTVDLTYVSTNEPEDMDFYNGKPLLYCGQNGGIYKFKLK